LLYEAKIHQGWVWTPCVDTRGTFLRVGVAQNINPHPTYIGCRTYRYRKGVWNATDPPLLPPCLYNLASFMPDKSAGMGRHIHISTPSDALDASTYVERSIGFGTRREIVRLNARRAIPECCSANNKMQLTPETFRGGGGSVLRMEMFKWGAEVQSV